MGSDKAQLMVKGEAAALRTARELDPHCGKVTILGRTAIPPFSFLEDREEYAGPLSAIARFDPAAESVFIASCDMPRFEGRLVPFLHSLIGGKQAVVPVVAGRMQPLCALYSVEAWDHLPELAAAGSRSMMSWLDKLSCRFAAAEEIEEAGINLLSIQGANTPDEWQQLASD